MLSCAGCRAIGPQAGNGCGEPCRGPCCEQPVGCGDGCCDSCGRGGNLEDGCQGGNCCAFDRYCGHNCGPGYHPGPYDCSPCDSPHWGCTGHRHPMGYRSGQDCRMCDGGGREYPCQVCGHCHPPGPGYCCGSPGAPGSCNSGDQFYNFTPGPPVAQAAYPYYTLRGPRDFLLDNPPSIGPY